jgi:hypothetical protein
MYRCIYQPNRGLVPDFLTTMRLCRNSRVPKFAQAMLESLTVVEMKAEYLGVFTTLTVESL